LIRWFKATQAAATEWYRFALAGVEKVEAATGPDDLARRLNDVFQPIAPTVRIVPTGNRPHHRWM
jgi:hypothetical protein